MAAPMETNLVPWLQSFELGIARSELQHLRLFENLHRQGALDRQAELRHINQNRRCVRMWPSLLGPKRAHSLEVCVKIGMNVD